MIYKSCKWHFGEELGCDDGPNDALAENFNSKPIISLIRESIQNSLDATNSHLRKPVKMKYEFGEISLRNMPNFKEIREHIVGCSTLYPDNPNALEYFPPMLEYIDNMGDNIGYIKVSDYNTIGMNYVNERKTKEPFYAFVRSKGVTAKNQSSSGGSFGFGKAAYFGMSKIKTLLVSTRTDDGKAFFEGVSSLCTHLIDDQKKCAVGYYDNNGGKPINSADMIPSTFLRSEKEPGTDFWILGYDKKNKNTYVKEMIEATLRNFWLAIHTGILEVEINGVNITKETLPYNLQQYFTEENDTKKWRDLYNPRPYYEAIIHGEEQSAHFKCISANLDKLGEVKIFAYLNREGSNRILLTRKPKMLVQLKNVSPIGVCAVFTCDNEEGNQLLRRMENPAHNTWSATRKKDVNEAYKELESFIISSIEKLKPQSGKQNIQVLGLSDLTWIPETLLKKEDSEDDSLRGGSGNNNKSKDTDKETGLLKPKLISVSTTTKTSGKAEISEQGTDILGEENTDDIYETSKGSGGPSDQSHNGKGGNGGSSSGDGNGPNPGENKGNGSTNKGQKSEKHNKPHIASCRFKQYALKQNGKTVHHLCIDSPKTIRHGKLYIQVNTEKDFINLPIKEAINEDLGCKLSIEGNTITNITISKGHNMIAITFYDNIKHSLKLKINENL